MTGRLFRFYPIFLMALTALALGACNQASDGGKAADTGNLPPLADGQVTATGGTPKAITASCEDAQFKSSKLCEWVLTEETFGDIYKRTYTYDKEGRMTHKKQFNPSTNNTPMLWMEFDYGVTDPLFGGGVEVIDRSKEYRDYNTNGVYDQSTVSYTTLNAEGKNEKRLVQITYQDGSSGNSPEKAVTAWDYSQTNRVMEEFVHMQINGGMTVVLTKFKRTEFFNNTGLVTSRTQDIVRNNSGTLEYLSQKEYLTYNGAGLLSSEIKERYNCGSNPVCPASGVDPDEKVRETYTYNSDGKKLYKIRATFDFAANVWIDSSKCTYDHDANGNVSMETCEDPNDPSIPKSITTYAYKRLWESASLTGPGN